MIEEIEKYLLDVKNFSSSSTQQVEEFKIAYLSQKGILKNLFSQFKEVPTKKKKEYGQKINELKQAVESKIVELQSKISPIKQSKNEGFDYTLPSYKYEFGSRHPISIVKTEIIDIFKRLGYSISEGPEIEDDWHNFSALNFPEDHPARDMQDTFFVSGDENIALRTHTSSVQIRVMESQKPPFRTISPGRVYRNEAISARANCFFNQIEGLYIDENVSMSDLKQNLLFFAQEMFGTSTKIRLRPSYFPFTEPSAEMDISCFLCDSKGCNICKQSGWVEILGCGMVDPNVLNNCNIDAKKYNGFAFGMGVERITMLKYQINDIRLFYENDVRFLEQFSEYSI